jgi:hypothetical protein
LASPLQPEFFLLLGLDIFLAASLLTCLLDKHFPSHLPYLLQIAALAGFGQLIVSREFMGLFDEYMRFWYSLTYLIISVATLASLNVYLGIIKKLATQAKIFTFLITIPATIISAFFITSYSQVAMYPLLIVPTISWEATFIGIVALDTCVVGLGTYVFFKPKWWHVALGAGVPIAGATIYALAKPTWGAPAFIASAVALAVACVLILGISIYVLAKIWKETLQERRRKKEVKY